MSNPPATKEFKYARELVAIVIKELKEGAVEDQLKIGLAVLQDYPITMRKLAE